MKDGARAISRESEEYPARLRDLRDAPPTVFVRGELTGPRAVAIVGTRRADPAGIAFTETLARDLARAAIVVVSGGAQGIDAAAHRGALSAGAPTIVVHGTALDRTFPRANRRLFDEVLERGGAWLGETPPGARSEPWRFLQRNRLIAALAEIVIVVQAPVRSGALWTAAFARSLSRPLFAVPAAPWDPRGEGANELLARGARVCRSARDVLDRLGLPHVPIDPPRPVAKDDPELALVLRALAGGATHVDEIVEASGLAPARVQVALVQLSIAGRAIQCSGIWRARG